MDQLSPTDRTRVRRHPERAHTDRAALDAILDEGWVVHVGFAGEAGQPFVIPTSYVRLGRTLYIHGAPASRMLRAGASGVDLCATVTLIDGLVLARSAFHHSMNYRSAVIVGRATLVEDDAEKARVLTALVEHLIPGRCQVARAPDTQELRQTAVLQLPLEEASVKIRGGPPIDQERDLAWPAWAGVIPLTMSSGSPRPVDGAVGAPPARTLAGTTPTDGTLRPATVERTHGDFTISDDRARIDFGRVAEWLAGAYWCPGIPRAAVEHAALHSSLVLGAFASTGEQVGYLRVVSDCTRFANLMDVFVAPERRGRGLGRAMVRLALEHPRHRDVPRWLLGTKDAHGVYAQEGFRPLDHPERLMQRMRAEPWNTTGAAASPALAPEPTPHPTLGDRRR
jgi:nitroimidazol reductase NimA-like FMN-containing flavoprotein (pyridoxamine 5'-phosphate oxidase superfamily)/GNAT superfamily N-acetyltransferase